MRYVAGLPPEVYTVWEAYPWRFGEGLLPLQDLPHRDYVIGQRPHHPRLHCRAVRGHLSPSTCEGGVQQLASSHLDRAGRLVLGLPDGPALPAARASLLLLRKHGELTAVRHRTNLAAAHALRLPILHLPPLHPAHDCHHDPLRAHRHHATSRRTPAPHVLILLLVHPAPVLPRSCVRLLPWHRGCHEQGLRLGLIPQGLQHVHQRPAATAAAAATAAQGHAQDARYVAASSCSMRQAVFMHDWHKLNKNSLIKT
jgi:hypothetical protein